MPPRSRHPSFTHSAPPHSSFAPRQLARLDSLGADGLNLDIEGSRAENRDALTALVAELAAALRGANPRAQLSFDTGIYPLGQADAYDHVALAVSLDFFVPMAYDMCWGAGAAAANCPIGGLGAGLAQYTNDLNISAAQLVVGLPWYGWDFPCADATAGAPCDVAVPDGAEWFGWCTQVRTRIVGEPTVNQAVAIELNFIRKGLAKFHPQRSCSCDI